MPRLMSIDDREPNPHAMTNPEMAQFHLWLAQIQRDRGNISDKEMGKVESAATHLAPRSRMIFNPFTGEVKQAFLDDYYKPGDAVFLGDK